MKKIYLIFSAKKEFVPIFLTSIFLIIGLISRLFFVFGQPLWLDEQFSIFFAQTYSYKELLFSFSSDIHPGMYYAFLKLLIEFTSNIYILRIITSTVPDILSYAFLISSVIIFLNTSKKATKFYVTLGITFFYFLNPFVIDQSWQLRMYSLVLLFSSASFLAYLKYLKKKKIVNLFFLIFFNILGIASSYTFILLTAIIAAVLIDHERLKLLHKVTFSVLIGIALACYFLLLSGYNNRSQFEYANWIQKPSIEDLSSVYLTVMGVDSNIHGITEKNYILTFDSLIENIFFVLIFICLFFLYRKSLDTFTKKTMLIFVAFPTFLILSLSLFLEILSNRIFLHTFIPNISLFLPRTHTAYVPIFWFSTTLILNVFVKWINNIQLTNKSHSYFLKYIPLIFMCSVYIIYLSTTVAIFENRFKTYQHHFELLNSTQNTYLIVPEWILYLKIDPSIMTTFAYIELDKRIELSKKISNIVTSNEDKSVSIIESECSLYSYSVLQD